MRAEPSVLHLDLDAFFAAVEQRDKPSLRGKPVVVGGTGGRGVVATASYEARAFGVRSAMPIAEARRRCPHAAFLGGRFGAYREASRHVMAVLHDLSPLVEPLSLDEAYVDLTAARRPVDLRPAGLHALVTVLRADVAAATGGLRASVGVGSSKFIAKVASELAKPDGVYVVAAGQERDLIAALPVGSIPGVGPVTVAKLAQIGLHVVADLRRAEPSELRQLVGAAHADGLRALADARDDRPIEPERETKSISVEDTFETDLVDRGTLTAIVDRDARQVAARLAAASLFARTVVLKIRRHDFSTHTRSRTIASPTDRAEVIAEVARGLLGAVDTSGGIRLLGVGVAGLTEVVQDHLFDFGTDVAAAVVAAAHEPDPVAALGPPRRWRAGADVSHDAYGPGWVWGAGRGRVTVRFETRATPPGPVRTFADDDPALHLV